MLKRYAFEYACMGVCVAVEMHEMWNMRNREQKRVTQPKTVAKKQKQKCFVDAWDSSIQMWSLVATVNVHVRVRFLLWYAYVNKISKWKCSDDHQLERLIWSRFFFCCAVYPRLLKLTKRFSIFVNIAESETRSSSASVFLSFSVFIFILIGILVGNRKMKIFSIWVTKSVDVYTE